MGVKVDVKSGMPDDLLQHVVEEPDAGGDVPRSGAVQIDGKAYLRLFRLTGDRRLTTDVPSITQNEAGDIVPVVADQRNTVLQLRMLLQEDELRLWGEPDGLAPQVLGKLDVGQPVADDQGVGKVKPFGAVLLQHGRPRFPPRAVVRGQGEINVHRVEQDPFPERVSMIRWWIG
jgi:hypothetical protein